jgi:DNA-directed RNA polymerase specialized sigma24 family protein
MTIADARRVRAALDADWHDLCAQYANGGVPACWCSPRWCCDDTPVTAEQWARLAASDDDAAGAAVRTAQAGDRCAGRAVLHLLSPRLTHLASRDPHHDLGDYVATAWLRVMLHPIETRPHALLTNLALATLKELSRSFARQHRTWPDASTATVERDLDAQELLDVAARAGWLPRACEPVLRSVYCDGLTGREAARRHATSPHMVRYRCSVGVKALRAHRQELLEAA